MKRDTPYLWEDLTPAAMFEAALMRAHDKLSTIGYNIATDTSSSYQRMRAAGSRRRLALPVALVVGTFSGVLVTSRSA